MKCESRNSKLAVTAPVAKFIGFKLIEARDGGAVCEMKTSKRHLNIIGTVHGGILCDLSDAAMGFAFYSFFDPSESGVTIEFKINFFIPVKAGDYLRAQARTLSRGKSIHYLECEIRNASKTLVAKAASTCKLQKLVRNVSKCENKKEK